MRLKMGKKAEKNSKTNHSKLCNLIRNINVLIQEAQQIPNIANSERSSQIHPIKITKL